MKRISFFLLAVSANSAFAGPPVLDATSLPTSSYPSTYSSSYSSTSNSTQLLDAVNRLQSDVAQLKNKLADQTAIINDLRARETNVEKALSLSSSSTKYATSYNPQATLDSYATSLVPGTQQHDPHNVLPGEKGRYDYALSLFKSGSTDQAIAEFQSLINTYPNGEYADNAQYWTGEALLKKGDKQGAMRAFDRVVYAYPRSPKVSDALLKLGMTQATLGNKSKAKEYYDYLIAAYPGSPAAGIAFGKRSALPIY